jgi:hypothetical protein
MIKKLNKDMTTKEAKEFYGEELWNKMLKTKCLDGITCEFNKNGEVVIFKEDLDNAYFKVITGKRLFFD